MDNFARCQVQFLLVHLAYASQEVINFSHSVCHLFTSEYIFSSEVRAPQSAHLESPESSDLLSVL